MTAKALSAADGQKEGARGPYDYRCGVCVCVKSVARQEFSASQDAYMKMRELRAYKDADTRQCRMPPPYEHFVDVSSRTPRSPYVPPPRCSVQL